MTPEEAALRARVERMAAEAVQALKDAGALQPTPGLLELSYSDCRRLVAQGYSIFWLMNQLHPVWAPWPDKPLSDVLKTQPKPRLEQFARELGHVGLHDLDELLLPADPESGSD